MLLLRRYALAAALYEERLARYEALAAAHREDPEVLLVLLGAVTQEQSRIPGLFRLIFADEAGRGYLAPLWQRSTALFAAPLAASRRAGSRAAWARAARRGLSRIGR